MLEDLEREFRSIKRIKCNFKENKFKPNILKKNISRNITEIILIKNLNKNHYSLILLGKNATKQKKSIIMDFNYLLKLSAIWKNY